MNLATFVKERRKAVQLTQEEFAERAGVALTVVRKIEQGKTNLNMEKVNLVLRMFGNILAPVDIIETINVIIFDGEREYSNVDIITNTKLRLLRNTVISLGGFASIAEEINNENGVVYITADKLLESGTGKLKGVSAELYDKYRIRKP